ncbi:MAG: proton-conducting transporter membrane subunit [Planctomycetaceae bacterium]
MESLIAITFVVLIGLFLLACVPSGIANANAQFIRRLVTSLLYAEFILSLTLFATYQLVGATPLSVHIAEVFPRSEINVGVYYDGSTSLMLLLVAFVGFVVSRFSIRYLDGEAAQGRYYRWLSFTIGAVSLMVVAGNLLLFFIAWVMTSLGLHQLLLHYRHRPAAHRAAWTKFAISRFGDALLMTALFLTWKMFGTFDLSELFLRAETLSGKLELESGHVAIAWLLMLGAMTKSAQFPFHIWLPDTMESPTPVSALMHAGIVNAGGYLVIRMSPLISLAPNSLLTLAMIGGFTACFAGVIMMTQPSIKRALAYSTIAQMGFMMLQCGLGAFSAAMLHIVAHSLYKAHAFLSSGSVLAKSGLTAPLSSRSVVRTSQLWALVWSAAITTVAYAATLSAFDVNPAEKPGGFVLGFILCVALTTWGWKIFTAGRLEVSMMGALGIAALSVVYVASYTAVDRLVSPLILPPNLFPVAQVILAAAFASLVLLHSVLLFRSQPTWLANLHVHAANGFYIEAVYQRLFSSLVKS